MKTTPEVFYVYGVLVLLICYAILVGKNVTDQQATSLFLAGFMPDQFGIISIREPELIADARVWRWALTTLLFFVGVLGLVLRSWPLVLAVPGFMLVSVALVMVRFVAGLDH